MGVAYQHADRENERGHYWAALISGVVAIWTLGIAEFDLISTNIATGALFVGLPLLFRIAPEVGFSLSEIICPDLKVE